MTTRRSFLQTMAGVTAAVAMDVLGLKAQATAGIKMIKATITKAIVNPAYATAQYEDVVVWSKGVSSRVQSPFVEPSSHENTGAFRYNLVDGKYVEQPLYKEVTEEIEVPDDGTWKAMDLFEDPRVRKVRTDWPEMGGKKTLTRMEIIQKCRPGHPPGPEWKPIDKPKVR